MDGRQLSERFDHFRHSAFRLETRQRYAIGGAEEERLRAFRQGRPRPERSVTTNGYLAQVARATLAGKHWSRVHIVDWPLSEYLRYELVGYVESAAVGEEILIASRDTSPELAGLREDFWLFDEGSRSEMAVVLDSSDGGEFTGAREVRDAAGIEQCRQAKAAAMRHAVRLNAFLAAVHDAERVA